MVLYRFNSPKCTCRAVRLDWNFRSGWRDLELVLPKYVAAGARKDRLGLNLVLYPPEARFERILIDD